MVVLADLTPFGGTIVDRLRPAQGAVDLDHGRRDHGHCARAVLVATGEVRVWHLYVTAILDGAGEQRRSASPPGR